VRPAVRAVAQTMASSAQMNHSRETRLAALERNPRTRHRSLTRAGGTDFSGPPTAASAMSVKKVPGRSGHSGKTTTAGHQRHQLLAPAAPSRLHIGGELCAVHNVAWSARVRCRPCSETGPCDFIPTVSRAVHEREWTGEGLQCRGVPRDWVDGTAAKCKLLAKRAPNASTPTANAGFLARAD
jgi:hypothetical protein